METGGNRKGETACPFCREKVMSTESIVIDPFDPDNAPDSDYEDEEEFNLPMVSVKPRTASQRQRSKDKVCVVLFFFLLHRLTSSPPPPPK